MSSRWIQEEGGPLLTHRPTFARMRVGDVVAEVEQGGIIGRSQAAALRIRDARVSEAHATISCRGESLVVVGLRRKLIVMGKERREVALMMGMPITLVDGVDLIVEQLHFPPAVVYVGVNETDAVPLVSCAYSLFSEDDVLSCRPGYSASAIGFLLWRPSGWVALIGTEAAHPIRNGDRLLFGANVMRFSEHRHNLTSVEHTTGIAGVAFPMRVVVRYDTVHLHRADRESLVVSGVAARIISELVSFGVPTPWEMAAREIWTDGRDRMALRRNWDRHLGLLRHRLRESRYPEDLVRPDGCGNVELFLRPQDQLIDQS